MIIKMLLKAGQVCCWLLFVTLTSYSGQSDKGPANNVTRSGKTDDSAVPLVSSGTTENSAVSDVTSFNATDHNVTQDTKDTKK
jgi:hypothetical protein